jgi:hypothetical protein
MSINYTEKLGLQAAIAAAGYNLYQHNQIWVSDNDVAVQAIIDSYNPLAATKAAKISSIKSDGLARVASLFPALGNFDMISLEAERWQSLTAGAKSPTANFAKLISIYVAATGGISAVNAATDLAGVAAVTVTWP